LFRIARDEILMHQPRVTRDAIEREGTDARAFTAGMSAVGDEVINQNAQLAAKIYLDSAKGSDLDHLIFDRYGLPRKPATVALGSVQFTTPVSSVTTFNLPAGINLQTADGKRFITTESSVFVAGSEGPITVAVRSVLAGVGQGAAPNTIRSITDQVSGAPANLQVSNQYATSASDDAETDDAYKARARLFFTTARRGTIPALEAAALGIPGVRTAKAFEGVDGLGRPARFVNLVVADAFTEEFIDSNVVPARYAQQSQALAAQVFSGLSDVRPGGMFVQVTVANTVLLGVQLALSFNAGADPVITTAEARAIVLAATNSLRPGQPWIFTDMLKLMGLVQGLVKDRNGNVPPSIFVSPVGDVVPKPLQVLRTTLALVSAVSATGNIPLLGSGTNPDSFLVTS
jgi:uncharacterized phage protein gp47/JayE